MVHILLWVASQTGGERCKESMPERNMIMQEATRRIRDAIRQRYVLLPYIYTLFRHANTTGQPVMRPLWFDFPEEAATFAEDNEFMLGPGLLVNPLCSPSTHTSVRCNCFLTLYHVRTAAWQHCASLQVVRVWSHGKCGPFFNLCRMCQSQVWAAK